MSAIVGSVSDSEDDRDESTTLLPRPQSQGHKFPFLRARVLAIVVPMLLSAAFVSRDTLLSQYLVDRLGQDENKTQDHVAACRSANISADKISDELESKTADLLGQYALLQTIPAFFVCFVFGSYSDFLGRRILLLVPVFTGVVKLLMTSLIIGYHLSLKYMYLAYAVDGLSGSWFTILVAVYAVTADINTETKSRTMSIFLTMCFSAASQAVFSIVSSDLISSLGYFDASLLIVGIGAVSFVVPLFLFPETLHCQQPQIFNTQTKDTHYQAVATDQESCSGRAEENLCTRVESPDTKDWVNPVTQLRRLFGFYLFDGPLRRRAEMTLLLLVFMLLVANEINLGVIDSLYQLHRPFCWGPEQIGRYNAIRAAGSNIIGGLWLAGVQKCLSYEVIAMTGAVFQGAALVYEAFIAFSWQFYIIPILLVPAVPVSAAVRGLLSVKAKPQEQGALFSSIAVVETLCTLASTTSFNKVYSLTLASATPGAVYILMSCCSALAFLLFILYFVVRERRR